MYTHWSGSQIFSGCLAEMCDPQPDPGSRFVSSAYILRKIRFAFFHRKNVTFIDEKVVRSRIWLGIANFGSQAAATVRPRSTLPENSARHAGSGVLNRWLKIGLKLCGLSVLTPGLRIG